MTYTKAAEKAITAISEPSNRSKQRTAGVSDIVNPCDRCVAEILTRGRQPQKYASLAALLGTAFHALAEKAVQESGHDSLRTEVPLHVGTVGNTTIKGTADLVDLQEGEVLDWKVLSRKKIRAFHRAYALDPDGNPLFDDNATGTNLLRYYLQLQVYAHAVQEKFDHTNISTVSLLLVPRDAALETTWDIGQVTFPYDPEVYEDVMVRARLLSHEGPLDEVPSDPYCYTCNRF